MAAHNPQGVQPVNKATALLLRDALLGDRRLSDYHELPSVEDAIAVAHHAGLATGYVPLLWPSRHSVNRRCEIYLAVFDLQCVDINGKHFEQLEYQLSTNPGAPTRVHSLTRLHPFTDYLGELVSCDLSRLWWAAPTFFTDLSRALAPWSSPHDGGRSHWGAQDRHAFSAAFDERWRDWDDFCLTPGVIVSPMRLCFDTIPIHPIKPEALAHLRRSDSQPLVAASAGLPA